MEEKRVRESMSPADSEYFRVFKQRNKTYPKAKIIIDVKNDTQTTIQEE